MSDTNKQILESREHLFLFHREGLGMIANHAWNRLRRARVAGHIPFIVRVIGQDSMGASS